MNKSMTERGNGLRRKHLRYYWDSFIDENLIYVLTDTIIFLSFTKLKLSVVFMNMVSAYLIK